MNQFTDEEIYKEIIFPLFVKFKTELTGFADKNVTITKEKPGGTPGPGWTYRLAQDNLIDRPEAGGKYIELERCLSSIIAFYLLLDGSQKAYEKFTSTQNPSDKLSYDSFTKLHKLAKELASDEKKKNLLIAMLIYSDLGKTPNARKRALERGINNPDHDDWIEQVLSKESNAEISYVLPSFFALETEQKNTLKAIAGSLKVHLGHVLHLEGGIHMFDKLSISLKTGNISHDNFKIAFLIQMCDVSASQGQVSNQGMSAMTENTFEAYQMVWQCLEKLFHTKSPEVALRYYLNIRGEKLGIKADNPRNQILIRLACMLRLYTAEQGEILKKVANKHLNDYAWLILVASPARLLKQSGISESLRF